MSTSVPSPRLGSTLLGSRIAQMVASTNTTKPYRSAHSGPAVASTPAIGAESVAPTTPAREVRALALTSGRLSGARRGTAAARVTPYALDATSTPSAAAKTIAEPLLTDEASTQHRKARSA